MDDDEGRGLRDDGADDIVASPGRASHDSTKSNHSKKGRTSREKSPKVQPPPNIRVLSADIEKESQKVRSFYEVGDAIDWGAGGHPEHASSSSLAGRDGLLHTPEDPSSSSLEKNEHDPYDFLATFCPGGVRLRTSPC
jgi:hypothetical protein